jgi:hypothetical protein
MKAITVLADPKQVHEHVRALWRTDLFRRSHDDTGGFVRAIIDRFAALPRVLYDMSEPDIEASPSSLVQRHRPPALV